MKILQLNNSLGAGGAEKILTDICLELQKKKHKIEILQLYNQGNVYEEILKRNSMRVRTLAGNKRWSFKSFLELRTILKNEKYDVVHVHIFPAQYYVSLASIGLKHRFKLIATEHSVVNRRRNMKYIKPLEKIIYSRFDNVICVGKKVRENLLKHLEIKREDKFITILNGVRLDTFQKSIPYDREFFLEGRLKGKKVLMMIARFSKSKDHLTLIKSLRYLSSEIHLLLVGEGDLKEKCMRLSKKLELEDRVSFLGYRNDIPRLLRSADISILSSHFEGMPLSALEAMATGKPFIGSDVLGLKEIVGKAGLLFEKGNSEELAEKIKKLLDDPDFYRKIGEKCLQRSKFYNLSNMIDKYIEIYKS